MFEKIAKEAKLISLPSIYLKLKELMDEPDYSMADVAILVGSDPAMAIRFLRAVNNPLNRRVVKIETVSHAVSLLGIRQVHDLVLSASVAETFQGMSNDVMSMEIFWKRSFYCAEMIKQLGLECGGMESDRLFTIGLLHDIGHLIMYSAIPEESQLALQNALKSEQPLFQVERELLGFDYAKLGGYMMEQWNLPESFQAVTRHHPEPGKAIQFEMETALLHLSSMLVKSDLEEGVLGEGAFTVHHTVWQTTNLTEEQCIHLRQTAAEKLANVENDLFV